MINAPQKQPKKTIITINSIKQALGMLSTLSADSIVCFDIDDTITSSGKNKHIVEAETLELIKNLRRRGITVIAVTARLPVMQGNERIGDHLLKSAGVNLKGSKFGDKLINLSPVEGNVDRRPGQDITCLYENGILYTSNGNKGQALFQLLRKLKIQPSKVVLFDDRKHNLEDMYNSCLKNNMEFLGFEYLAASKPKQQPAKKQPQPVAAPIVRPAAARPAPQKVVPAHLKRAAAPQRAVQVNPKAARDPQRPQPVPPRAAPALLFQRQAAQKRAPANPRVMPQRVQRPAP